MIWSQFIEMPMPCCATFIGQQCPSTVCVCPLLGCVVETAVPLRVRLKGIHSRGEMMKGNVKEMTTMLNASVFFLFSMELDNIII